MKLKRVVCLLIVLITLILSASLVNAAVFINEILANGPSPEPGSEWIEIYNNDTNNPVYTTSWRITDGEGNFTLPASLIPANGFIVLAYNDTLFNATYTTSSRVIPYGPGSTGNFDLNNTYEGITLYDSVNSQIDQFFFNTPSENVSIGRNYDGGNLASQFTSPTPGTYNNRKPVLSTNIPDQTWAEDNNQTVNLNNYFTDPDSNPMTFTATSTNNVTANIVGPTLTFVPDTNFYGTRTLTITASDNLSTTISNTFQLNITAVNDVPSFNFPTVVFNEESSTTLNLNTYTTDPDNAVSTLTWTRVGGDSNIGVSINPTTHIATINATPNYCGLTTVILNAADSNTTSSNANINVNVTCIQDSPTITLTSPSNGASINTSSINLQWTGNDPDNDNLIYEVLTGNLASNLTSQVNTTTTSHALAGLVNTQTVHWRVIAKDNQTAPVNSPIYSFSVNINTPPTINAYTPANVFQQLTAGQNLFFQVNVTDPENDALTYSWTLDNAVQSTSSSWTYQTTLTTSGSHTVTMYVTDGNTNPISQTWVVTVTNSNPSITQFSPSNLNPTITEGQNLTFSITAVDPENETLSYNYTFNNNLVSNTNTWTYASNYTSAGIHIVKATVADSSNHLTVMTWILTVAEQNTPPNIFGTIPDQTQDEDADPWTIDLTQYEGDLEDSNPALTWSVVEVDNLVNITIDLSTDLVTFTPIQDAFGTDIVTFVLTDSGSLTTHQNVTITLNPINDPPSIEPLLPLVDNPKITEDANFTFTVVIEDVDSNTFNRSWYLDNYPTSAITNTYDFVSQGVGEYNIKFVVDDGQNISYKIWTLTASDKPLTDYFDGSTPIFNNLNETELADINLTLEKVPFGRIVFNQSVDLRDTVDLDRYAFIGDKFVSLDGSNLPALNVPAIITLTDITFDDPVILYKTGFTRNRSQIIIPCTFCENISYKDDEFTFRVPHFSSYRVEEKMPAELYVEESSIQLGEDNADRGVYYYANFTISNTGTYESLDDVEIYADTPSKYEVGVSLTGSSYSTGVDLDLLAGETQTIYVRGKIPTTEESGKHSIGEIKIETDDDVDEIEVYVYPGDVFQIKKVEVDSQSVSNGGSVEINPDSTIDVEIELENMHSLDMDVEIEGTIYDLDGDDETDDISEFKLSAHSTDTKTLSFSIPDELDDDSYDLEIEISAVDQNNNYYDLSWNIDLDVEKDDHDLKLDADLLPSVLTCSRETTLDISVKNNGASDEDDVRITVKNSALGIDLVKSNLDVDENERYQTSFNLDLSNEPTGTYTFDVTVYRDDDNKEDEESVVLTIKPCSQETEVTSQTAAQQIAQEHQKLLSQQLAEAKSQTTQLSGFRNSEFYWVLIACLYVITLGAIVFAAGAFYIKIKK